MPRISYNWHRSLAEMTPLEIQHEISELETVQHLLAGNTGSDSEYSEWEPDAEMEARLDYFQDRPEELRLRLSALRLLRKTFVEEARPSPSRENGERDSRTL